MRPHQTRHLSVNRKGETLKSKNLKVEEAQERLEAWQALTPVEQLAALNRRSYQGVVPVQARRQRRRIERLLKKA